MATDTAMSSVWTEAALATLYVVLAVAVVYWGFSAFIGNPG